VPPHVKSTASRSAAGKGTVRWAAGVACLVLAIAVGGLLIRAANRPSAPPAAVASRAVPGFGEVSFKVAGPAVPASLANRKRCALLATTEAQQRRGLMNRRDLAGYDGMIFQFNRATTVPFFMKDTLIPLSIAWFNPSSRFLNSTTMSPCPKSSQPCPLYSAVAPYSVAIEVRAGLLSQLGIGPGATIALGGPC
jgi:uncharacterized membrane protein (UPF0127 family)